MRLQKRDRWIARYIEDFGCANTSQLAKLYFPSRRRAQQRLKELVEQDKLKRSSDYISTDYLYYVKKPKEVEHMLLRGDTYVYLKQNYNLLTFIPEYCFGDLRADAYFEIARNGYNLPFFLEIQLSSCFRQDKYENAFNSGEWLDIWEQFPTVIIVSDNRFKLSGNVKYIQFKIGEKIKI